MRLFTRSVPLVLAALLSSTPASAAEKSFGLTSFDRIMVQADYIVEVTTRSPVNAVATGSPEALDRVVVDSDNGTLTIRSEQFAGDENRKKPLGPVTIRVNAALLREAAVAGAGSLTIDRMKGATVALGLHGPGHLTVGDIRADRLSVAMIGNGTMALGGTAKRGQMILSGAGSLDAAKLVVSDLTTDSEGSGDHIFNATKTAAITTRGLGKTVVLGKPSCTVRNVGSGSVICGR